MKHIILLLLCFLLLFGSVHAAKVRGAIYDHELNPIKKAVVYINTTPEQKRVSQYGGYHFIIEPGTYEIWAELTKNQITKEIAREQIVIPQQQGEYVRDLFLYDDFSMDEEFEAGFFERFVLPYIGIIIGGIIAIIGIIIVVLLWRKQNPISYVSDAITHDESEETEIVAVTQETSKPEPEINDPMEKKIVGILIKQGGETSQKDIRRHFHLSEAKISLVLADLEKKGIIGKKKQGRSNVIVLNN